MSITDCESFAVLKNASWSPCCTKCMVKRTELPFIPFSESDSQVGVSGFLKESLGNLHKC